MRSARKKRTRRRWSSLTGESRRGGRAATQERSVFLEADMGDAKLTERIAAARATQGDATTRPWATICACHFAIHYAITPRPRHAQK